MSLPSLKKVLQVINLEKPTPPELVELAGRLLYSLGASIAQKHDVPSTTSLEELQKRYYSFPSLDSALMVQGLLLLGWKRDLEENPGKLFFREKKEK